MPTIFYSKTTPYWKGSLRRLVVEQVDVTEMAYKTHFFKKYMPETNNATLTCFTMEWQHKYQEDLYFTEVFGFLHNCR